MKVVKNKLHDIGAGLDGTVLYSFRLIHMH